MHPITVTDVRVLPGDSAFLLDDGHTAILYDSGFGFTGDAVAAKIKKILGERPLNFIFLTHSHYDHALGSAYVRKTYPETKVVAGEYAARIFAKPSAKATMRDLDRKFATQCGVSDYEDLSDFLQVDLAVADGDSVQAGDMEFVAIHLPGHTKCSFGFYCPTHQLLLGSETIGVYNGTDDVVPAYLVGYRMTLDSIARVKSLKIEQILVPHYGLLYGEEAQRYLVRAEQSAKDTAAQIVASLRAGQSKAQILARFKEKFYHGYIKEIYPVDAMELNTSITIDLLNGELLKDEQTRPLA